MKKMKMKNSALIWIFLTVTMIVIGLIYVKENYDIAKWLNDNKVDTVFSTKTDTLWKDTTITKTQLVPKYIYEIKHDTVYDKEDNPIELITENKVYQDTILCNKDTAEFQIFISGIKSYVDSINLHLRKSEVIKTNTITITKYIEKEKTFLDRIHVQPQMTGGYDIANRKWGVVCGVGVGIDI